MKAILLTLLSAGAALVLAGCESDVPPARHQSGSSLERGIRGEGRLTQPDRSDDPLIRENTRVGY